MAKWDAFMQDLRRSDGPYSEFEFEVRTGPGEGDVLTVKGLWAMTDGGYHAWRCLQYPDHLDASIWGRRHSKRMESVRG